MSAGLCTECREGRHTACLAGVYDASTHETATCTCFRCHPPPPETCDACGGRINPQTAECQCSD